MHPYMGPTSGLIIDLTGQALVAARYHSICQVRSKRRKFPDRLLLPRGWHKTDGLILSMDRIANSVNVVTQGLGLLTNGALNSRRPIIIRMVGAHTWVFCLVMVNSPDFINRVKAV